MNILYFLLLHFFLEQQKLPWWFVHHFQSCTFVHFLFPTPQQGLRGGILSNCCRFQARSAGTKALPGCPLCLWGHFKGCPHRRCWMRPRLPWTWDLESIHVQCEDSQQGEGRWGTHNSAAPHGAVCSFSSVFCLKHILIQYSAISESHQSKFSSWNPRSQNFSNSLCAQCP